MCLSSSQQKSFDTTEQLLECPLVVGVEEEIESMATSWRVSCGDWQRNNEVAMYAGLLQNEAQST